MKGTKKTKYAGSFSVRQVGPVKSPSAEIGELAEVVRNVVSRGRNLPEEDRDKLVEVLHRLEKMTLDVVTCETVNIQTGSREVTLKIGEALVRAALNSDKAYDVGVIIKADRIHTRRDGGKNLSIVSRRSS
jgi:hypothetical protein